MTGETVHTTLLGRALNALQHENKLHRYNGLCPDVTQPAARDPKCPGCRLLDEIEATLAMPPIERLAKALAVAEGYYLDGGKFYASGDAQWRDHWEWYLRYRGAGGGADYSYQARLERLAVAVLQFAVQRPACALTVDDLWNRTAEKRPTTKAGEQEDVIFCSPGWATPIVGLYECGGDTAPNRWSGYDQKNDRFYDWGQPEPELWMYKPKAPDK